MNIQEFQAQQEADFWQQKADIAKENAAFISQSYHQHTPPQTVNDTHPYSQIGQLARRNISNPAYTNALMLNPNQQPVSAFDPSLQAAKAQAQQVRNAQLEGEVRATIAGVKQSVASIGAAVNQAVNQAQARQAQVQRSQTPPGYRPAKSAYTDRPSINKAIVNQSLGMSPVEPVQRSEPLPVSPITGKPSTLRAMINKSVGM